MPLSSRTRVPRSLPSVMMTPKLSRRSLPPTGQVRITEYWGGISCLAAALGLHLRFNAAGAHRRHESGVVAFVLIGVGNGKISQRLFKRCAFAHIAA